MGGKAVAARACATTAALLQPSFSLVPGLLAGGKGSGVHPFSRLSPNRVYIGLGFARRRCSEVELGSAGGAWLLCGLVFLVGVFDFSWRTVND
jgi:hypothetical protein